MWLMLKTNLKNSVLLVPLMLLVVACQILLGRVTWAAINRPAPEIKIAVSNEDGGELSEKYIAAIENSENIEIVRVDEKTGKDQVFLDYSFMGFLHLPEYFTQYLEQGKAGPAILYLAPGVTGASVIEESLMTELVVLRAEILLEEKLHDHGLPAIDSGGEDISGAPLLSIEYHGPKGAIPFMELPSYGIPGLMMLLAFIHGGAAAAGVDRRRVLLRGERGLQKAFIASILLVFLFWLITGLAYAASMYGIYGVRVPNEIAASLIAVGIYSAALGGLLAMSGKRHWTIRIFVPLFVLNMTLGGGLWDNGVSAASFIPILPLSCVTAGEMGFSGFSILMILSVLLLAVSLGIPKMLIKISEHQ